MRMNRDLDTQFQRLMDVLNTVAPANIASIPVAFSLENGLWTVDVHVKVKRVTEYEYSATHESLPNAIANTVRFLLRQDLNEQKAIIDQATYHYSF